MIQYTMNCLFLDDVRRIEQVYTTEATEVWQLVRNYDEFVSFIEYYYSQNNKLPDFISFDHDLADEHYRPSMYNPDRHYTNYYHDGTFKEKTGYHCAKWLVDFCIDNNLKLPQCLCHSMNPIGKENILSILRNFKNNEQ